MRQKIIAPLFLAAIGILLIVIGSTKFKDRREVFRVADFRATVPTEKTYPVIRCIGIAVLAGGVILLVPGLKKS